MKRYILMGLMVCLLPTTKLCAEEKIDRTGVSFGLGVSVIGGCWREDDYYNEETKRMEKFDTECLAFPIVDISLGYGFTPQFKMSFETQTFFVVGLAELKGQYYLKDEKDTYYVHAEVLTPYAIDTNYLGTTGGFGIGYAKGHAEYELGVILVPSEAPILSLGVKYMF